MSKSKKQNKRGKSSRKLIKKIHLRKRKPNFSLRTKILVLIGLFLVIIPICFYTNETIQLAFFTPHVKKVQQQLPPPIHISIPAVLINLSIKETAVSKNVWEIAPNAISHLNISATPGENGPIVLYGHNTNDRFGPIRWLSVGQQIYITTADNKMHVYIIYKTEEINPNQITALTKISDETLVLYTCDGFADLNRFLVYAAPQK